VRGFPLSNQKKNSRRQLVNKLYFFFRELENERDGLKSSVGELTARMTAIEEEMTKTSALFESTSVQLQETHAALAETTETLAATKSTLENTQDTLAKTAHAKAQSEFLLGAHVTGQDVLHTQATALLETAAITTTHVDGLHAKISRKVAVEAHNRAAVVDFAEIVGDKLGSFHTSERTFSGQQAARFHDMAAMLVSLQQELSGRSARLLEGLRAGHTIVAEQVRRADRNLLVC
jgi:hypothetical protein